MNLYLKSESVAGGREILPKHKYGVIHPRSASVASWTLVGQIMMVVDSFCLLQLLSLYLVGHS